MREYIFTLAAVAVITSIAISLSHTEMKKTTSTALGILVLCAVAAPIGGLVASLSDMALRLPSVDAGEVGEDHESAVREAFEDGISAAVAERLGQNKENIEVRCDGFNMSAMRAESIHIRLKGAASLADPQDVRRFVLDNFTEKGECRVELVPW